MYQHLRVALDPSPSSRRAARAAADLAEGIGASVQGLVIDDRSARDQRAARLAALLGVDAPPATGSAPHPAAADVPFEVAVVEGAIDAALVEVAASDECDLLVVGSVRQGEEDRGVGPTVERLVREARTDVLVVKDLPAETLDGRDHILVCVDGSQQSFAGLRTAIELGKRTGRKVEAAAVYDPYLHYTLFNGIVNVLSAKASAIFKFADQEKLHEEIIDTGLAKIYQAHLDVSLKVARDEGCDLQVTLLDGKAFQKLLRHAIKNPPWLMVMGRIGVHSDEGMDIGATTENLLRTAPCDLLITSETWLPPVDVQASASVEWVPEALAKMERVPAFVKGVATTAILRWAIERGHSVITPSLINQAMGDLLPPGAAQAMGYVAEDVALQTDNYVEGSTFICRDCGHAVRDLRPASCKVCNASAETFEEIDRSKIEAIGRLEKGFLEEETTFDGKKLTWTEGAKEVIRRVPSGYQRRRSKARIEKTARVRGLQIVSQEFAIDMVEQDLAETSYLTSRGEALKIEVKQDERPDDAVARAREESPLPWTDAAWKRICRVPQGFMRDMTREKVEEFAAKKGLESVDLALCEEGIAEGRKMMAEMLGNYKK